MFQNGWHYIDGAERRCNPVRHCALRVMNQERNLQALIIDYRVVDIDAMFAKALAMVGDDYKKRIFIQAQTLELVEQVGGEFVHIPDRIQVIIEEGSSE